MSLLKGLGKNIIRKAVDLDVHLGRGDTVLCSGHLEVHVTEVILITEDVGQDGVTAVRIFLISDKSHSDSGDGLGDLDTGIHQSKATSADGSL